MSAWRCCAAALGSGPGIDEEVFGQAGPVHLNAPRSLIAGLALLNRGHRTNRRRADLSPTATLLMVGSIAVGGLLGDSLYILSMARIGLSRAYPIAGSYPAVTLLLAVLFMHEEVTMPLVAGLALVVGGVMLVSRPATVDDAGAGGTVRATGIGLALLASVCWAGSAIMLGPGAAGVDAILASAIRIPALALMFWGVVALRRSGRALLALSRREWFTLLFGGLIGWGLGSMLFVIPSARSAWRERPS